MPARVHSSRRGRPQKFGRPARPVTLTLPEDTLAALKSVDPDVGLAIVRVVDLLKTRRKRPRVTLSRYGRHAIIVVTPVRALKRLPGVEIVPIGADRAIIAFSEPMTVAQFELRVQDALEMTDLASEEREALRHLVDILKDARRSGHTALTSRTIIVLEQR
jgi:hypothetical protein